MIKKMTISRLMILSIFLLLSIDGCGSGSSSSSSSDSVSTIGKAGSLAKYAVVGDYLYTINSRVMDIVDVSDAKKPKRVSKIHLPWDVETIFSYKDYLYIGAESGVYIYDNSNPLTPTSISKFTHVQSCDPVVVSDDIAYVTLNTGSSCWRNRNSTNRLEILDVRDPKEPELIKVLDMWSPTGLGVDGDNLFICDGESGLKHFKINRVEEEGNIDVSLDLQSSDAEIDCYDVIAHEKRLIVSNRDEIRQFDYGSSSSTLEELGSIK